MLKHLRMMCALAALMLLLRPVSFGQAVTGTVVGSVTDTSGGVVTNARITLTEVNTNTPRAGASNSSGNFTFSNLPEGRYTLNVELEGFKKEIRQNITVAVNQTARVDVQLQPGNISQSVEVTAAPPALQTDRADTSVSISTAQTANLPTGLTATFKGY